MWSLIVDVVQFRSWANLSAVFGKLSRTFACVAVNSEFMWVGNLFKERTRALPQLLVLKRGVRVRYHLPHLLPCICLVEVFVN